VSVPEPPSILFAPPLLTMVSSNREPMAFSIEDSVSVLRPSAVTPPARLISTALAEVAYDAVSEPTPPKSWSEPSTPPSSTLSRLLPRIVSLKREPMAFSIEDSVSVLMPSAVTWPARLMRTFRAEVA
jgi:hypothetical protein